MQVDRFARGLKFGYPGGQARTDRTGQYVAGAGRGQARIAGWVDTRYKLRRCNDRARALEYHRTPKPLCKTLRGGQPVVLYSVAGEVQQARRLERMGRQHGTPIARGAGAQLGLQLGVARDRIERIRVQHQARGGGQYFWQMGTNRVCAAAAAYHAHGRQVQLVHGAQHQFRLLRVDR